MCARYEFSDGDCSELRELVPALAREHGTGAWTPGEIHPSAAAPVLLWEGDHVALELLTWGFPLPQSLVINARAESAAEKPLFKDCLAKRRCVIPAAGFWEWDPQKRKYFFKLQNENLLYMAGIYDIKDGEPRYCILTTESNDSVRDVHPRMPLVLTRQQVVPWLREPEQALALLRAAPPMLEKTTDDPQLRLW